MKRWLVPISAALAVLLLLGGVLFALSGGETDPSAGGSADGSSDVGFGSGGSDDTSPGGGEPGSPGQSEPGSPGDGPDDGMEPLPGEPVKEPPPGLPSLTNPNGVFIDSYFQHGPRRLAINYTTGVPECYGTVQSPLVVETKHSVTVTLTRTEPEQRKGIACIEIALMKSVDIQLSAPLGARTVRDGSAGNAVVRPAPAPYESRSGI